MGPLRSPPALPEAAMPNVETRFDFPNAAGEKLAGLCVEPAAGARAWALFAHCFTCSKDLKAVNWISRELVARGIAVLRFDFTGLGESDGDFADTNFTSNLDDLVAAADFMRERFAAPQILVGHSLGGAAVLAAARRVPESVAVATIGAPSDPAHLRETLDEAAPSLATEDATEVRLAGRRFTIRRQLLEDLGRHRLDEAVGGLKRALLVMHSPIDEIVGIDHAAAIYRAARHPKSFVSLDDADHLLMRERDARYAATVLAAWAGRYLPQPDAPAVESGEVVVRGGPSGYANDVVAGHHRFPADEPPGIGTDTGPGPYDLLLASLGACTSMTLRMYADRKGWPLEGTEVRLRHGRVHARDCEDCESTTGLVDEIRRTIALAGPLDDEQRARLMEIADRCPVHRTLTTETTIRTEPAGG